MVELNGIGCDRCSRYNRSTLACEFVERVVVQRVMSVTDWSAYRACQWVESHRRHLDAMPRHLEVPPVLRPAGKCPRTACKSNSYTQYVTIRCFTKCSIHIWGTATNSCTCSYGFIICYQDFNSLIPVMLSLRRQLGMELVRARNATIAIRRLPHGLTATQPMQQLQRLFLWWASWTQISIGLLV